MKLPQLSSIQNSSFFYEKCFKKHYILFLFSISALLFFGILWMLIGKIDKTIKVQAVMRPYDYSSIIQSSISSHINRKLYYSGQTVNKGDTLLIFEHSYLNQEAEQLQSELLILNSQLIDILHYEQVIKKDSLEAVNLSKQVEARILVFNAENERRRLLYEQANQKLLYEKNLSELLRDPPKIADFTVQTRLLEIDYRVFQSKEILLVDTERRSIEQRIKECRSELNTIQQKIKDYIIISPINGIVEDMKRFNDGDMILSGEQIARITPNQNEQLLVEMEIQNQNIQKIKQGLPVNIRCRSQQSNEWVIFEGIIENISADAGLNVSNLSNYLCQISMNEDFLMKGKEKGIVFYPGMQVDARIMLGKRRILDYVKVFNQKM